MQVLQVAQDSTQHRQPDQNQERMFVILGEELEDLFAIQRSEASKQKIADAASQGQCRKEFLARILQCTRGQEHGDKRKWRRQHRAKEDSPESPVAKALKNFAGLFFV